MTGWFLFRSISPLMLLALAFSNACANNSLLQADVEKFKFECIQDPEYNLLFQFSPVNRLSLESRTERQWAYEFASEARQYPDQQVSLPDSGAQRIDLVMQLNQSESNVGESYLWNVIAAPKVKGWKFGGHWPSKKLITEYSRLKGKRESLINMITLSTQDEQPVHTIIPPKDIDSAGTLNKAWEDVFGKKVVSNLVYPGSKASQSGQTGYSLTFYYVPTPALRYINREGYKWPSFKHVDKPGKVFGFLLTPAGECLAWDAIQVVRH